MEDMMVNAQEQRRVIILTEVVSGALTVAGAAERLALSERQVKRLLAGFRREGVAALVHGNRRRQPAHTLSDGGDARKRAWIGDGQVCWIQPAAFDRAVG
jgi:transposase